VIKQYETMLNLSSVLGWCLSSHIASFSERRQKKAFSVHNLQGVVVPDLKSGVYHLTQYIFMEKTVP